MNQFWQIYIILWNKPLHQSFNFYWYVVSHCLFFLFINIYHIWSMFCNLHLKILICAFSLSCPDYKQIGKLNKWIFLYWEGQVGDCSLIWELELDWVCRIPQKGCHGQIYSMEEQRKTYPDSRQVCSEKNEGQSLVE